MQGTGECDEHEHEYEYNGMHTNTKVVDKCIGRRRENSTGKRGKRKKARPLL